MGYEILQTFQFGREKEIPVGVEKAAILLRDGMEKVLQLKLKNNSNEILNELAVKITCFNDKGEGIGEQTYTYKDLFAIPGGTFGTNVPIPLMKMETETVAIEIIKKQSDRTIITRNRIRTGASLGTTAYNMIVCLVYGVVMILAFVELFTLPMFSSTTFLFPYLMIQMYYSNNQQYKKMKRSTILFVILFGWLVPAIKSFLSGPYSTASFPIMLCIVIIMYSLIPLIIWVYFYFISHRMGQPGDDRKIKKLTIMYFILEMCYLMGIAVGALGIAIEAIRILGIIGVYGKHILIVMVYIWSSIRAVKRHFELLPIQKEDK